MWQGCRHEKLVTGLWKALAKLTTVTIAVTTLKLTGRGDRSNVVVGAYWSVVVTRTSWKQRTATFLRVATWPLVAAEVPPESLEFVLFTSARKRTEEKKSVQS